MEPCPSPVRCTSAPPRRRRCRAGCPWSLALTGFTDAGSAVSQLVDYLRDELDPTPLAVFANDVLLDYRARRPIISFDQDHLTDYRPPRLELSLAHDALGQPFLLLTGYEPDFAWDAFTAAVLEFVDVVRGLHGHLGARDPDAGAAHPPDRGDRERQPHRPHRGALGLAAAHAGAGDRGSPARVPARRGRRRASRDSCC